MGSKDEGRVRRVLRVSERILGSSALGTLYTAVFLTKVCDALHIGFLVWLGAMLAINRVNVQIDQIHKACARPNPTPDPNTPHTKGTTDVQPS